MRILVRPFTASGHRLASYRLNVILIYKFEYYNSCARLSELYSNTECAKWVTFGYKLAHRDLPTRITLINVKTMSTEVKILQFLITKYAIRGSYKMQICWEEKISV